MIMLCDCWTTQIYFHCRDIEEFTSNFSFACPKFLSPVPPNYDTPSVVNHKVCIYIYKNEVYVTFFNS